MGRSIRPSSRLWQLYAEHFSSDRPDPEGPPAEKLAEALAKVGRDGLLVSADRVALARRAPRLPSTASPRATRPIASWTSCARRGLSTTLVNMGEIRAIGGEGRRRAVARRARRSGHARRDHGDGRPRRSRGRDHGRRRLPFRSGRPVHASVRSRDGTQSRPVPHGQRHCADSHRSGCAFDGIQPDAGFAHQGNCGRSGRACRPGSSPPAEIRLSMEPETGSSGSWNR